MPTFVHFRTLKSASIVGSGKLSGNVSAVALISGVLYEYVGPFYKPVISQESSSLDIERLLADLKEERSRIEQAIAALEGLGKGSSRSGGRGRGRRHMSAEARARISKAMKARWAMRKRKAA